MTVLLGAAPALIGPSEVGRWMASLGAPGAAAVLDFAGDKYGFREPGGGLTRWGSVAADLTFGRASVATYLDATGHRQSAAANVLRLDHDPVSLDPLGALIETARTNALTNPAFLSGLTSWVAQGGGSTLWEVVDEPAAYGGKALHIVAGATPSTLDARYQVGVLTGGVVSVRLRRISATGTLSIKPGGADGLVIDPSSSDWITYRSLAIDAGNGNLLISNPSAGSEWLIDWIQLENGASWSSSFIPGGTRAADRLSRALPEDPAVSGFTVAIRARTPENTANAAVLYTIAQASVVNRVVIYVQNAKWYFGYGRGGGLPMLLNTPATPGHDVRIAFSATPAGIFRWSVNGGAVVTADRSEYPLPTGIMLSEYIGSYPASAEYNSTIARVAQWRGIPHTDEDLRGLLA